MPKLLVLSGESTIIKLKKIGYKKIRQKGSHVRLRNNDSAKKAITIPLHKELKPGLLHQIIKDAGISIEELKNL